MYYNKLLERVNEFRNKYKGKLVQNNTRMYMDKENDSIKIKLHTTDILTFYKDNTVRIYTGGWHTVTTKARLNSWLPGNIYVYSENGNLYCRGYEFIDTLFIDLETKEVIKELSTDCLEIFYDQFKDCLHRYCSPYYNKTSSLKQRIFYLKGLIREWEKAGCKISLNRQDSKWKINKLLRDIKCPVNCDKKDNEKNKLFKKEFFNYFNNDENIIYKNRSYKVNLIDDNRRDIFIKLKGINNGQTYIIKQVDSFNDLKDNHNKFDLLNDLNEITVGEV